MIDWENKVVLVTGGTGSFGKQFIQTLLSLYHPKKIIVFSRDEMKQYDMQKKFNHPNLRFFIGDVRDCERLHRALQGVHFVVHAAALKIVPAAEYNPFEAVKTNIIGAENVINMSIDNGVERVVALSTDKAANPVNLYGATKLCSEKMFSAANYYSPEGTRFSVVRYGNVFGSRGSVVPLFRECRKTGGVPITHKDMTRFWITLEQGVDLVISSFNEMIGGEIFIPKLPSVRVTDLATAVCPDCKPKFIGIRSGEKIHETLVSTDEGLYTHELKDKYIIYSLDSVPQKQKRGKLLGVGYKGYSSDNNTDWLSVSQLRKIVEDDERVSQQ